MILGQLMPAGLAVHSALDQREQRLVPAQGLAEVDLTVQEKARAQEAVRCQAQAVAALTEMLAER